MFSFFFSLFLSEIFFLKLGRYSPVRRASEGSRTQFQGPLQECQYLQKGIAQRNLLIAPSPPLLDNSISLPGKKISIEWEHCYLCINVLYIQCHEKISKM